VKDGPAVARELRWRAKQALGYSSEDEESGKSKYSPGPGSKRRRVDDDDETSQFKNFNPKTWDAAVMTKEDEKVSTMRVQRTKKDGDWTGRWMTGREGEGEGEGEEGEREGEGEEATVKKSREIVVKVRRTRKGIERQRIERCVEEWTWL